MLESHSQKLRKFTLRLSTPEIFIIMETVAEAEKVVPYNQLLQVNQETEITLARRAEHAEYAERVAVNPEM